VEREGEGIPPKVKVSRINTAGCDVILITVSADTCKNRQPEL